MYENPDQIGAKRSGTCNSSFGPNALLMVMDEHFIKISLWELIVHQFIEYTTHDQLLRM